MPNRACLLLLAGLLAACAPQIAAPPATEHVQAPAEFPEEYYLQAKAAGSSVLRIDTKQSLVTINVDRSGALARLGHEHIVASHDVTGYVDITGGRADLFVPLKRLVVDETALRAAAGFDTQPSQDAIDSTRYNMLVKVLETDHFPFVLIRINQSTAEHSNLNVSITLHGTTKTFEVPAIIASSPDGKIISGQMSFKQTDFGIAPFSILGGALQVQDRVDLRFRIVAVKN
jgi:hypothetical protein